MNFNDYQKFINQTAIYPNKGNNVIYPVLGLSGEAGEVADKVKKVIRDHQGKLTKSLREELIKELGDVLWYMAALAIELDIPFEEVAKRNIQKLQDRKHRGVIHGEGDNR